MAGIVFITCPAMQLASGSKSISVQVGGSNQIGTITEAVMINGNTTVTIPAGAVAALLVPPPANTFSLNYGIDSTHQSPISRTLPTLITFDQSAPPASFVLSSSTGGYNVEVTFW